MIRSSLPPGATSGTRASAHPRSLENAFDAAAGLTINGVRENNGFLKLYLDGTLAGSVYGYDELDTAPAFGKSVSDAFAGDTIRLPDNRSQGL